MDLKIGVDLLGDPSAWRESVRVFTFRTCFINPSAGRPSHLLPKQGSLLLGYCPKNLTPQAYGDGPHSTFGMFHQPE